MASEYNIGLKTFRAWGVIPPCRRVNLSYPGYVSLSSKSSLGIGISMCFTDHQGFVVVIPYKIWGTQLIERTGNAPVPHGYELYTADQGMVQGWPVSSGPGTYYQIGEAVEDSFGYGGVLEILITHEFKKFIV